MKQPGLEAVTTPSPSGARRGREMERAADRSRGRPRVTCVPPAPTQQRGNWQKKKTKLFCFLPTALCSRPAVSWECPAPLGVSSLDPQPPEQRWGGRCGGKWGSSAINSDVYLGKFALHRSTSFVTTILSQAGRRGRDRREERRKKSDSVKFEG